MHNPFVSIIIPTYNRAHLIGETLDSVLVQTYENWECIIVDDGSTDETDIVVGHYVQKDNRFQYHHRPANRPKGANACRNYGFELSKGEFVNWFDDDDVMLEVFIENKIVLFEDKINFVICSGNEVNNQLHHLKELKLDYKGNLFKEYALWQLKVLTPSILFRKSFLDNFDLFSTTISRGQETELFSRLFFEVQNGTFKIVNTPLFLYRQHEATKTSRNDCYVQRYKESQSHIALENLKRSLKLNDAELVTYYYKGLLNFFFRGLENDHKNLSKTILFKLNKLIFKNNKVLVFNFFLVGIILITINRSSYKMEQMFKKHKVI
jgi:glycosyltransferase involved in cell wall biosynthesis